MENLIIEGRNAVIEAFRSGKPIDKLFVLDGCQDGPIRTIIREAKKHDTIINFVGKERLDQLSETKKHQGVIAYAAGNMIFSTGTQEGNLQDVTKSMKFTSDGVNEGKLENVLAKAARENAQIYFMINKIDEKLSVLSEEEFNIQKARLLE